MVSKRRAAAVSFKRTVTITYRALAGRHLEQVSRIQWAGNQYAKKNPAHRGIAARTQKKVDFTMLTL